MNVTLEAEEKLIAAAQRLYDKNLLAACDGNLSCRISEEEVLITPSGRPKWAITSREMAHITVDNEILRGSPSSEMLMHTFIYRHCKQARVVIHAHPPHAIAWTIGEPDLKKLPSEGMSEVILACGEVPIAPYARPGTEAMGEVLKPFLPEHKGIILARHGAITWGDSVEEACNGMERIEHSALILLKARQLGPLTPLPQEEVEALWEIRRKIGNKLL